MRITHKPGDAMQVDWAGEMIPYYDTVTGEEYKAYCLLPRSLAAVTSTRKRAEI
jgi:hypothetical protein